MSSIWGHKIFLVNFSKYTYISVHRASILCSDFCALFYKMKLNKVISNYLTLQHACTCVHVPHFLLNLSFQILSKCHQNSSICTSFFFFFLIRKNSVPHFLTALPNPPPLGTSCLGRHFVPQSCAPPLLVFLYTPLWPLPQKWGYHDLRSSNKIRNWFSGAAY